MEASDAGGVYYVEYSVDGSTWTKGRYPTLVTDGAHSVAYRAVDLAGNVEGTKSMSAKVDVLPPVTTVTGADDLWHNHAVELTLAVDAVPCEEGGGVRVVVIAAPGWWEWQLFLHPEEHSRGRVASEMLDGVRLGEKRLRKVVFEAETPRLTSLAKLDHAIMFFGRNDSDANHRVRRPHRVVDDGVTRLVVGDR